MRPLLLTALALCVLSVACPSADAAYPPITYRYRHFLFTIDPDAHPEWQTPEEVWLYRGAPVRPPAELRVDGDEIPPLPPGMIRSQRVAWNAEAIRATIAAEIAAKFDRPARNVVIRRAASGSIVFDGVGLPGRRVDLALAAALTVEAIERGGAEVVLPVIELPAEVTVDDAELSALGIREVVTVGESNYTGSPEARKHNIAVGLSKFNGHIILAGETFSFNEVLGDVNASTGYRKELVILGDQTLPDYGGGLCQVSTTAYRGAWEYGLPITQRRNHSYAVSYYSPQGTDATIYPPHTDMQFTNDSPAALLLQTYAEDNRAYFIYYGTRDARASEIIGPFTWGYTAPPADRTEYTTDIAAGTRRKVGDKHPGMKTLWFRSLTSPSGEERLESVFSGYEARPLFYQIGIDAEADVPDWFDATE
ncbi:MAG: VanW family protein [Candidatus Peregrinibacteria bacterium]|nr:VanW family protein [Candidatus Peregrinibacteria bacterium]